jgi:hypothetical protein
MTRMTYLMSLTQTVGAGIGLLLLLAWLLPLHVGVSVVFASAQQVQQQLCQGSAAVTWHDMPTFLIGTDQVPSTASQVFATRGHTRAFIMCVHHQTAIGGNRHVCYVFCVLSRGRCAAGAAALRAARAALRRDALSAAASSLDSIKQQVVAALARLLAYKCVREGGVGVYVERTRMRVCALTQ